MLRGIIGDSFEIKLIESEKDRGIPLYKIIGMDYDDNLTFEDIDELIELLQFIKQNNIK